MENKLKKIDFSWIIIFLLSIIAIVFLLKNCEQREKINYFEKSKKIDSTTIKQWKDKYGKEHTISKINEINFANLLNSKDEELNKLREEWLKDKTIKDKTILNTKTKQKITAKLVDSTYIIVNNDKRDTIINKNKILTYNDEWIKLKGEISKNDSVIIDYEVFNKFDITTKEYKHGFLNMKKDYVIEIVNQNPNTTTDKIIQYKFEKKPKKFYETRLFSYGIGILSGVVIYHQISK